MILTLENKHQSSWRRMLPVGFSEIPCRKLVLLCCIRFLVAGTKYRTPTSRGGSSFSGPGLGGIHPWWAGSEPSRGGRVPPGQPWGHGAESRSAGWFRGGGKQGPGREHRTGRSRGREDPCGPPSRRRPAFRRCSRRPPGPARFIPVILMWVLNLVNCCGPPHPPVPGPFLSNLLICWVTRICFLMLNQRLTFLGCVPQGHDGCLTLSCCRRIKPPGLVWFWYRGQSWPPRACRAGAVPLSYIPRCVGCFKNNFVSMSVRRNGLYFLLGASLA